MNNYIVRETPAVMRQMARDHLQGNWIMVYCGVAFYYIMATLMPQFFDLCVPLGRASQAVAGENVDISVISQFYSMFFTGVFSVGLASFMISFVRLREIHPTYVFNGFEYYMRCLALSLVKTGLIFLWTLLLIIPGIIASILYSQAEYILADDPSKGVMQCIAESKWMMDGNKASYFVFGLSYIGWIALSAIPLFLVSFLSEQSDMQNAMEFILTAAASLPLYLSLTYLQTGVTVFYELVSGHLRARQPENDPWQDGNQWPGSGQNM